MMWDQILQRVAATCEANPTLAGLYGMHMRHATEGGQVHVPSLDWMVVADSETELWAPCLVQFDQWTRSMSDLAASERVLRHLFHRDVPGDFAGIQCFFQYEDGSLLASPERNGFCGRAIRFRLTPLRE